MGWSRARSGTGFLGAVEFGEQHLVAGRDQRAGRVTVVAARFAALPALHLRQEVGYQHGGLFADGGTGLGGRQAGGASEGEDVVVARALEDVLVRLGATVRTGGIGERAVP